MPRSGRSLLEHSTNVSNENFRSSSQASGWRERHSRRTVWNQRSIFQFVCGRFGGQIRRRTIALGVRRWADQASRQNCRSLSGSNWERFHDGSPGVGVPTLHLVSHPSHYRLFRYNSLQDAAE